MVMPQPFDVRSRQRRVEQPLVLANDQAGLRHCDAQIGQWLSVPALSSMPAVVIQPFRKPVWQQVQIAITGTMRKATNPIAAKAAAHHVQRSINIFLGSVLSTIALTIPAMIVISYLTGHPLILGVEHTDEWLLIVTLGVSIVTFASGHANVMQGCVHLILFAAYILLIFQG
jgi:hypothetical protein